MRTHATMRSLLLTALAVLAMPLRMPAQEPMERMPRAVPVTGMKGWAKLNSRVSGLALAVEDAGWPTLRMLSSE